MKMSQLSVSERLAWVTLLCLAHEENKGGLIRYISEDLLRVKMGIQESDQEWEDLEGIFQVLSDMEMIEIRTPNIFLMNFRKRQEKNLIPAEKMARYRAKKKMKSNKSYPDTVTDVTGIRTEQNRTEEIRDNTSDAKASQVKKKP